MAKIGRNQPCPCGSGKKYKKCCLDKLTNIVPPPKLGMEAQDPFSSMLGASADLGAPAKALPPYIIAKMFERSDIFARMQQQDPARARRHWTPSKVAALETHEIVARLNELKMDPSRERFLALTDQKFSAWDVSTEWRRGSRRKLSRHTEDFVGLAACELWKRYCPERPSLEMLDDWMQQGYVRMMAQQPHEACDIWLNVWDAIRVRLEPDMRTVDGAAVVFDGTQSLHNWVQDFAIELSNATNKNTQYADVGVRFCRDILMQFPDESELFVINFRADLGQFHFMAGDSDDGEQVFSDLISDYPDLAAGYARFSDMLAYRARREKRPEDLQRAKELLEYALAKPVKDAADYDLASRLEFLNEPQAHASEGSALSSDDTERATRPADS